MTPLSDQIILRVDPSDKKRLMQAAEARGVSLSKLILDAALKEADREHEFQGIMDAVAAKRGERKPSAAFRMLCREAAKGGVNGWARVGQHLAYGTEDVPMVGPIPPDAIAALGSALHTNDRRAVWEWYLEQFPAHMLLVPSSKQARFVDGVQYVYESRGFDFQRDQKSQKGTDK